MKHMYQKEVKSFIRDEILAAADELGLTQEQTAELLGIEPRSYAYLKNGTYMCSATTLIVYLAKICPDPIAFIEAAKVAVARAERGSM